MLVFTLTGGCGSQALEELNVNLVIGSLKVQTSATISKILTQVTWNNRWGCNGDH